MTEIIYLGFFIFFVILCQGITGVFSENVGESNSLIRRKRVLNMEPGGDIPVVNGAAPYIVDIKDYPSKISFCVGAILSKRTVITSAPCVAERRESYLRVLCSSTYKNSGVYHTVIGKRVRFDSHPQRVGDGVALLIVDPPFHFNLTTQRIELREEPLVTGIHATIYGWGCNPSTPRGTVYIKRLRSITVPIMKQQDCRNHYQNHHLISDKDICTYHPHRRCGHIDGGTPLVVENTLAGVYLRSIPIGNQNSPDIFVDVQHLEYGPWIRSNIVWVL